MQVELIKDVKARSLYDLYYLGNLSLKGFRVLHKAHDSEFLYTIQINLNRIK